MQIAVHCLGTFNLKAAYPTSSTILGWTVCSVPNCFDTKCLFSNFVDSTVQIQTIFKAENQFLDRVRDDKKMMILMLLLLTCKNEVYKQNFVYIQVDTHRSNQQITKQKLI